MKAAILTAPRTFNSASVELPPPGKNEVLVRVLCAGVCGSDLHFYESGRIGDAVLAEPFVMGHEFMGVIAENYALSHAPAVGTRVAVDPAFSCGECEFCRSGGENICPFVRFCGFPPYSGAYCRFIHVPVQNVFPIPDSITDEEGPVLETLAVALHGLELIPPVKENLCGFRRGFDWAAGHSCIAALWGNIILVTEPVPERRELARTDRLQTRGRSNDPAQIQEYLKIRRSSDRNWSLRQPVRNNPFRPQSI